MKPIKGGTFQMGSNNGKSNERPVHTVTVSDFYMDSPEVTQKDFIELVKSYVEDSLKRPFALFGLLETIGKGDNYPMYNISWYDMVIYCNARSKKEGYDTVYSYDSIVDTIGKNGFLVGVKIDYSKVGYRLPTEAEWEYACRGNAEGDYFWGPESLAPAYAWYNENSERMVYPVAQKLPNNFGLYDICGNVFEFCNDWYAPYDSLPQVDPHGPSEPLKDTLKVGRGGSMYYGLEDMRITRRLQFKPNIRYHYYGFRCVLSAKLTPIGIKNVPIKNNTKTRNNYSYFIFNCYSRIPYTQFSNNSSLILYLPNGKVFSKVDNIETLSKISRKMRGKILIAEGK